MTPIEAVSVFGLGKLGACIAATLAQQGFAVTGVDVDPAKIAKVNSGEPPVEEPLLAETIQAGRSRFRATQNPEEALETDASFFIPPSPSLPDGSFSNEYLLRAMQSMAAAARRAGKKGHLFVVNSTTTPGTVGNTIIPMLEKETGWKCGRSFSVCYNPEFIALGNVIRGLLEPDFVLIGESDPEAGARLEDLYRRYNTKPTPVSRMSIASAELTKISVNSYITMKISFTNQLRLITERLPGADIHEILGAIGSDSRIGHKYLRPGLSYGGPCFPRDNRLLSFAAKQVGLEAPLAEAADRINEMAKQQLLDRIQAAAKPGETVVILGMAYKPDTYIVEESIGLFLAQKLRRLGHRVLVHDFMATSANSPALFEFERLERLSELPSTLGTRFAVVCTPWPGYGEVALPAGCELIDPWGIVRSRA